MRKYLFAALAATALAACGGSETEAEAETEAVEMSPEEAGRVYLQAVNDIARIDDVESDANRKPAQLLAFAQIEAGDVVGDYIMGGGYVTRLLATAVGAKGKVYAFQPEEFIAFRAEYGDEQDDTVRRYADTEGNPVHVFPLRAPLAAPGWPEQLDTIITVMNWHDLYLDAMPEGTPETVAAMLFDALKPGGTLVVVDHYAAEGAGAAAAENLHRMDAELARATLTGAGFVVEAESEMYSRPDDPRTANVFDEAIRGQTDQFAWRLRKPE